MVRFIAFVLVLVAAFGTAGFTQGAREETVNLYRDMNGKVFYNSTFFVNDPESPVQITAVQARHIPNETAQMAEAIWDQLYRYLKDSEKNKLRDYTSPDLIVTIDASGEDAVAVKFGVIAYDAFKEYLGGLTAVTMDPPTRGMQWEFRPTYLFKFKKYGVIGAYVRQVRLKDGSIWDFNVTKITDQVSQRFVDITEEQIIRTE